MCTRPMLSLCFLVPLVVVLLLHLPPLNVSQYMVIYVWCTICIRMYVRNHVRTKQMYISWIYIYIIITSSALFAYSCVVIA